MTTRISLRLVTALALCLALVVAPNARANVLLADIFFDLAPSLGDADLSATLSLNGMMIPAENQLLHLSQGDTLRAELSGSASSMSFGGGDVFGSVEIAFTLSESADQASVHSIVDVIVDTSGVDAIAEGGRVYDCSAVFDCSQPSSPGAPEFGFSAVTSDAAFGNERIINDIAVLTGRTGGVETLTVEDLFALNRPMPGLGNPGLFESAGLDVAVFEDGTATASVIWELTVIPIPAAAWLFGSALGLLGWVKRRST